MKRRKLELAFAAPQDAGRFLFKPLIKNNPSFIRYREIEATTNCQGRVSRCHCEEDQRFLPADPTKQSGFASPQESPIPLVEVY
jgi:hypothetical protein